MNKFNYKYILTKYSKIKAFVFLHKNFKIILLILKKNIDISDKIDY